MTVDVLSVFDRAADSPEAIPVLRRFLLRLAVRGGIVPHDPLDQEAGPLLLRVLGAQQAQRMTPPRDFGELALPPHWAWVQLGDVGRVVGGGTPPSGDDESFAPAGEGIGWLTPADLGQLRSATYVSHGKRDLTERGLARSSATLLPAGTVLFTSRAPIGYVAIAATELATNQGFKSVIPSQAVVSAYLALYFKAFGPLIDSMAPGTTFREVSGKIVASLPFPLPPLAEQHRIVAKVNELIVLCEELEAAQTEREARRDQLRTTSLRSLVAPAASKDPARFFLAHTPRMITRPEHINGVREAILSLAVRGRLVPQDQHQSQPLGSAGPKEDRLDLQLPNGWAWVRVSDVADARLGKMLDKARNAGRPYLYLRNTNVHWFDIRTDDLKSVPLEEADAAKYLLENGDVLICEGGHGIGRSAVWRSKLPDVAFQKALHRVRPGPRLISDFFAYCVFVYERAGILHRYFTGVGIPHFTGKALAALVFPLPPLAEQRRIVAKVDELMVVCDELEQSLAAEQIERSRLLEALLQDALVGGAALRGPHPRRPAASEVAIPEPARPARTIQF